MNMDAVDLPAVATGLADAFVPMSAIEQRLAREIYRHLLGGEPAHVGDLARRIGVDAERAAASLHRWPGVYFDDHDRVIGFWGLSLAETPHAILADGATTFAWCAFDPLFILPLAGIRAQIRSACPVTGEPIQLTLTPGGIQELAPSDAVISMLTPTGRFDAEIRTTFCHFVLYFASPEAGLAWTSSRSGTFLLAVNDGFEIAQHLNRTVFAAAR